jgi:exopolyphosphatase/guanosine-5'-triphosphate,3'-diphosphate pyrophosphatase
MSPRARSSRRATPHTIGVIDIGTNSVKLAVGYAANGRVFCIYTGREPTRIGRGLGSSGMISAQAVRRTAEAVSRLADDARRHGAVDVIAVGTYALRAARNGRIAARAIERRAGIRARILSGAEEAAMVLRSVRARIRHPRRHLVVIDIGGGSAELIIARGERTLFARSVPLGAVRLTERYLTHDPISPDEYAQLNRHIEAATSALFARVPRLNPATTNLVVSGGTATTAAAMLGLKPDGDGCTISLAALRKLEVRCLASTVAQRRRFRGLLPDRADIIPAGLAVLLVFVRQAGKRSVRVIEGGVRDGVMLEAAERGPRSPRRSETTARAKAAARKGR